MYMALGSIFSTEERKSFKGMLENRRMGARGK
jgi:hypothetical protein